MADVFAGEVDVGGPAITFTEISGSANASPLPDALVGTAAAAVPVALGAWAAPTAAVYANIPAIISGNFLFDFYYRIWVLPEVLNAQNPLYDVAIPFAIWNAYPQPLINQLDAISGTGTTGLLLDFSVGDTWRAIEYKEVNVTITADAALNVAAEFEFDFDDGVGLFYFTATIADFVQMVPDPPVVETWSWLTDIIQSRDNTEQRIALRRTPRRGIKYGFLLEDEAARRREYQRWYKSLGGRIVVPYYQYHTKLTQDSLTGDTKLWFDPALTDVREGEFVVVMNEATETGYLIKLASVEVDGATADAPLQFDAPAGLIIAPAFTSRLNDRSGLSMNMVTGHVDVQAVALTYRADFKRPGSTAVIQTFDGLPVLHLRPTATGETPEIFDANYEVVDSETGVEDIYVSWPHPVVASARKWTIRRRQNPGDMDWWRDFLDTVVGQRDPFLSATWFADLTPAVAPAPGSGTLKISNPDYASLYFPFDTFQRLQIETEAGIIWRKVLAVTQNIDGTTDLQLDVPFGGTPDEVAINKVSFLNRTRLTDDTVTLTHDRLRTQIELPTQTVDI